MAPCGAEGGMGHLSPRGRSGGATWQGGWKMKGPRVSGPWLDSWGGNANALRCPSLYRRDFPFFLPCG